MTAETSSIDADGVVAGKVLVVGEALVDVVHRLDGTVDESPGGSPANVAVALGRLGRRVSLATRIAEDRHGFRIRRWLDGSAVRLVAAEAGKRTSVATARLCADGTVSYDFDLEWKLDGIIDESADLVHTGSIAALLAP
ncbi:PfkB family carbohydrate kinase, partial [Phytoactinopolyspora endophytica]|uniref:PfkB family carbohydrate kinase n=1 Tax=Phytoactinopolyspora endophytica TaxID=1642495 RepID=UPI001F0DF093